MDGFEEKIDSLLEYREHLDEEDREVFDMLIGCAREVAQQRIQVHC